MGTILLTDSEGYLVDPADWTEAFKDPGSGKGGLDINAEHWEIIRFLREQYARHGTQASVRDMIKHFRKVWDSERGSIAISPFRLRWPAEARQPSGGLLRTRVSTERAAWLARGRQTTGVFQPIAVSYGRWTLRQT